MASSPITNRAWRLTSVSCLEIAVTTLSFMLSNLWLHCHSGSGKFAGGMKIWAGGAGRVSGASSWASSVDVVVDSYLLTPCNVSMSYAEMIEREMRNRKFINFKGPQIHILSVSHCKLFKHLPDGLLLVLRHTFCGSERESSEIPWGLWNSNLKYTPPWPIPLDFRVKEAPFSRIPKSCPWYQLGYFLESPFMKW